MKLESDIPLRGTASDELSVHYTHPCAGEVTGQGACWVKGVIVPLQQHWKTTEEEHWLTITVDIVVRELHN